MKHPIDIKIKICGLRTKEDVETVISAGADFAGFVHCEASPRHVTIEEIKKLIAQARHLNRQLNRKTETVVLLVDPDDELLHRVIEDAAPDFIQLHGQETPERVAEIHAKFNIKIIKAIGIASREDIAIIPSYEPVAQMILLDAKPPKDATYPGGHGTVFDWNLVTQAKRPYLLAGGLTPENVAEALHITKAPGVDVSSGVEESPGIKSHEKIREFIRNARNFSSYLNPIP